MPQKHVDEFTRGWQGPSTRFLPLNIPNRAGKASIPAHIELTDPLALFQLYISDQMMHNWCQWSNDYAARTIATEHAHMHAHAHARDHTWREIDSSEIHTFIAIIIARDLWPVPNYKEY